MVPDMGKCPFNANMAEEVVGIQADLTGSLTSAENGLRVLFSEGEKITNAFVAVADSSIPGTVTALFADASVSYDKMAKPEGTIPGNIYAIQFQIPASLNAAVSWENLCVTDLRVLTAADVPAEDSDTSAASE